MVEFGTDPTRLCRWSGLVVSCLNSTTQTGPDMSAPATRSPTKSAVRVKFHYTDARTLSATRPDQTHGQSPYKSRSSGQVYDQTKSVRTCAQTQAVGGSGRVWSGRVRVVEFSNDTTSDKVWPRPSSGIRTLHHTGRSARSCCQITVPHI